MAVLRYVVPARGASLQTEFGLQVRLPHILAFCAYPLLLKLAFGGGDF